VYAAPSGAPTETQQVAAASLLLGPQSQLTGLTSLRRRGLRYVPADIHVEVLVPHERRRRPPAPIVVVRTTRLPAPHYVEGLPHSPAARMCTVEHLHGEVEAGPRAGSALVRRALASITSGVHSAPELDLQAVLAGSLVLPLPQLNRPIDVDGRRVVPDACWPEAMLGWQVLSVSPRRLRDDPSGVLREVEQAYLAGLSRLGA
jgi:hypothetical protein